MINKKDLKELIDNKLYLELNPSFDILKRENKFINLIKGGARIIEYRILDDYNFQRNEISFRVELICYVRFDIIHNWFLKYEFRSKKDLKSNWTYGETLKYYLIDRDRDVNKFVSEFVSSAIVTSKDFFMQIITIDQLMYKLLPEGIDGFINSLRFNIRTSIEVLTLLVLKKDPGLDSAINAIKEKLLDLKSVGDPMVEMYFDKFDSIIEDLKKTDFSDSIMTLD